MDTRDHCCRGLCGVVCLDMVIAAAFWWMLIVQIGTGKTELPQMNGPYPSQELCRVSARVIVPLDERFMLDAEKVTHAQQEQQRRREIAKRIKRGETMFTLTDGTEVYAYPNGDYLALSPQRGPLYQALSTCVSHE